MVFEEERNSNAKARRTPMTLSFWAGFSCALFLRGDTAYGVADRLGSAGEMAFSGTLAFVPVGGIIVLVILAVVSLAIVLLMRSKDRSEERNCLTEMDRLDDNRYSHPDEASKGYIRIINKMARRVQKGKLGPQGRKAYGRACFGAAVLLFLDCKADQAADHLRRAEQFMKFSACQLAGALARGYLHRRAESDEAIEVYLACLQFSAKTIDAQLVDDVVEFLEKISLIDDATSGDECARRIQRNLRITDLLSCSARVVVTGPEVPAHQYPLHGTSRIGRADTNDILLADTTVSKRHAVLTVGEEGFTLSDANSSGGTWFKDNKIDAPIPLVDGDTFRCGNASIVLFTKSRVVEANRLCWCYLNLGMGYSQRKEYVQALEHLDQAEKADPNNAGIHYYKGRVCQSMGSFRDAYDNYEKALGSQEMQAKAQYWWGRGLIQQAQMSTSQRSSDSWHNLVHQALEHMRKATEADSSNDLYLYALAKVLLLLEESEEAIEVLEKAIAVNPQSLEYRQLLLKLAQATRNADLMQKAAEGILGVNSDDPESLMVLGRAAFRQQDYSLCVKHFERLRIIEVKSGKKKYTDTPEFAWWLGRSLFESGRYQAASRALGSIARESRDAMFYAARCHSHTDRFENAVKILRTLISHYGEDAEARYYLSSALGNLGNYEEALTEIKPNEQSKTFQGRSLYLAARICVCLERLPEAVEYLERALQADPTSEAVHFERGRLAFIQNDYDTAAEAFRAMLRETPTDAPCHLWLGRTMLVKKDYVLANRHFKRALAGVAQGGRTPEEARQLSADAHYQLGRLQRIQKEYAQAITSFLDARKNGCTENQLVIELSACYAVERRYSDALAELSSLSMKDSENKVVKFNIAAISCFMAQSCLSKKRYEEAIRLLQQAADHFDNLDAREEFQEVNNALAEAYFRYGFKWLTSTNGHLAASLKALEQACSLRGDRSHYKYLKGAAYFKSGDYGRAVELFGELSKNGGGTKAGRALALSLEFAGNIDQAESQWQELIDRQAETPLERIDSMLGQASLHLRREDVTKTAGILQEILADAEVMKHQAYEDISKLAVSYLSLTGSHDAAEKVIHQHLKGSSADSVEAYLGAVLAQQDRLEESLQHLVKAIDSGYKSSAVLDLFEAVCVAISARKVIDDKPKEAAKLLEGILTRRKQLKPQTKAFIAAVNVILIFADLDMGTGIEGAVAAYESAYKKQPDNPKILRNLAILHHRMAIQQEEALHSSDVNRYWNKARQSWEEVVTSDTYWEQFLESYNEGRNRRDCLKQESIPKLVDHLLDSLANVHRDFVKVLVQSPNGMSRAAYHIRAFKKWQGSEEKIDKLTSYLLEEVLPELRFKDMSQALDLYALIANELKSKDKSFLEMFCNLSLQAAENAIWDNDISGFKRFAKHIGDHYRGEGDLREWANTAAATSNHVISSIIAKAQQFLSLSAAPDKTKTILFQVVLVMCSKISQSGWDMDYYEEEINKEILRVIIVLSGANLGALIEALRARQASQG